MRVVLTRTVAAQLRLPIHRTFVTSAFYVGMNVYGIMELVSNNSEIGRIRRARIIEDARALGMTASDVVISEDAIERS